MSSERRVESPRAQSCSRRRAAVNTVRHAGRAGEAVVQSMNLNNVVMTSDTICLSDRCGASQNRFRRPPTLSPGNKPRRPPTPVLGRWNRERFCDLKRVRIGGHPCHSNHDSPVHLETLLSPTHTVRNGRGSGFRRCDRGWLSSGPGHHGQRCVGPMEWGLREVRARFDQVGARFIGRRFHLADRQYGLAVPNQPSPTPCGGSRSVAASNQLRGGTTVLGVRSERRWGRVSSDDGHAVPARRPCGDDARLEPAARHVGGGDGVARHRRTAVRQVLALGSSSPGKYRWGGTRYANWSAGATAATGQIGDGPRLGRPPWAELKTPPHLRASNEASCRNAGRRLDIDRPSSAAGAGRRRETGPEALGHGSCRRHVVDAGFEWTDTCRRADSGFRASESCTDGSGLRSAMSQSLATR